MSEYKIPHKSFPSLGGISKVEFQNEVPDILVLFSKWLLKNDELADDCESSVESLTLSNIIMSFYSKGFSKNNLQIGLGLFLYNTVRSKKVIDLLYAMGFSCSYSDVRSMTTALAKEGLNNDNECYIPYGLQVVKQDDQNYIHASIDNFDLNEEAIDGKNTTHSMAWVFFQEKLDSSTPNDEIPKISEYSLKADTLEMSFQNIEKYYKPNKRPEPKKITTLHCSSEKYDYSEDVNFAWKLFRYSDKEKPFLGWSEFHNLFCNAVKVSTIAYLPFLNNPPTEFDTIYTAMLRLVQLAQNLNQKHIIIAADLAIYSKAQEILWNEPPAISGKVTLQLGGMHLTMAFIASIGFIYRDGGLSSMLVDTDVYAPNSCKQMLEGKQYSRAIRGLTLCADALSRLFLDCLKKWMAENQNEEFPTEFPTYYFVEEIKNGRFKQDDLKDLLKKLGPLKNKVTEFEDYGKRASFTFGYWLPFLKAVDLLLNVLKAERTADFELHLECIQKLLPYLTAGGRHLYAKWVPIYLKDMLELKLMNPKMYQYLKRGNFVVKKTEEKNLTV
jgi:hypothetical protein